MERTHNQVKSYIYIISKDDKVSSEFTPYLFLSLDNLVCQKTQLLKQQLARKYESKSLKLYEQEFNEL